MSYEARVGDLFEQPDLEAIGHGVNCVGKMGTGIAVLFKNEFPEMHEEYVNLCKAEKLKLGMVWPWEEEELELWVFNLATQFRTGANADIRAVRLTVAKALAYCERKGIESLGLPRIGSGVGGLNWSDVEPILQELGEASPVHLVSVTHPKDLPSEEEAQD